MAMNEDFVMVNVKMGHFGVSRSIFWIYVVGASRCHS